MTLVVQRFPIGRPAALIACALSPPVLSISSSFFVGILSVKNIVIPSSIEFLPLGLSD
jgi:hypothetical protein